jgi:hypothetical protein
MSSPMHPYFSFFPALPLSRNIELGDWVVGSFPDEVVWRSPAFKELVEKLLNSFATGDPRFEGGAVMWSKSRGFDGSRPSNEAFTAIQAAVRFAALDCNDHLGKDDPNKGHHLITSENADLHVQPIDEGGHFITHRSDGMLKYTLTGGWRIGDRPPPLAGATGAILGVVLASQKIARAVLDAHLAQTSDVVRRMCIAIEWHAVAMSNASAVTWQQRIIALKTGFEALLGTSDSRECARRLRVLFEMAAKPHYDLLPSANLLWSPKERTDLARKYKKKPDVRSEIEDWFMELAKARNDIIHEGRITITEYKAPPERPRSRYAGSLFWTGERVLREAIKARLGTEILLCGPLKTWAASEKLRQAFQAVAPQPAAEVHSAPQAPAPRTLATLLNELGCQSAREVQMSWSSVGASASEEAAREMAVPRWIAEAGGKEIWISEAEHDLLQQAGAEDELPDHVVVCD